MEFTKYFFAIAATIASCGTVQISAAAAAPAHHSLPRGTDLNGLIVIALDRGHICNASLTMPSTLDGLLKTAAEKKARGVLDDLEIVRMVLNTVFVQEISNEQLRTAYDAELSGPRKPGTDVHGFKAAIQGVIYKLLYSILTGEAIR